MRLGEQTCNAIREALPGIFCNDFNAYTSAVMLAFAVSFATLALVRILRDRLDV